MKKNIALLFLCLSLSAYVALSPEFEQLFGEEDNLWKILWKISWKSKYSEKFKEKVPHPVFTPAIRALEGKFIKISGYVVPVNLYTDKEESYFVLSSLPESSCFFCGGGGPETVMEVYPKNKKIPSSTNQKIKLKGNLKLNGDDFDHLIYILTDAEVIQE